MRSSSSPGSRPRSARRPAGQAQRWNSDVLASCAFCPPPFSFTPPAFERRGEQGRCQRGTRVEGVVIVGDADRKSTRLNSSHGYISYAVFCFKKKKKYTKEDSDNARNTKYRHCE